MRTQLILCFTMAAASALCRNALAEAPTLAVDRSFKEAQITNCLAVGPVGRYGRTPFTADPIEASIVLGRWTGPSAGTELVLPDGRTLQWQELTANQDGWFRSPLLRGGYAFVQVASDQDCVVLLEASGHNMVYANGEPRTGDPYQTGYVRLPVQLRRGTNQLLFHCARGQFRAKLVKPRAPVLLDVSDATVPDLVVGQGGNFLAAVVVVNTEAQPANHLLLSASCGGAELRTTALPPIPALTIRKVGFELFAPPQKRSGAVKLSLRLIDAKTQKALDAASLELRVRRPEQPRKITFRSRIDNSVQYYALTPAKPLSKSSGPLALVLSLHGAAVEAIGQAEAYSPKSWAHIVAPTNRRPYGFDWEDWGRLDALEVLELAQKSLGTDPRRVYLTGHSMGGHGTWNLAANCPDLFAAIGPSAGWISFWSYGGAPRQTRPSPIEELLQRSTAASDTLALSGNYVHHGVYILHGEADDNVPVTEARAMRRRLEEFHRDFTYYEQPGAGHWWDLSDEPGADCVDWAPMFDMFAHHIIPEPGSIRRVRFTTVNPGISSSCRWVSVEAQIHPLKPSTVDLQCDPQRRRFFGSTENVLRLRLSIQHLPPGGPISVELDGQKINSIPRRGGQTCIWLAKEGERWSVTGPPPSSLKGPHRYGPFKDALRRGILFVYATHGTPEENAWAFAKARYDAETFWYRGNGSVDVVPDSAFQPARYKDRDVVLYGNADTNSAWSVLLGASPVQVKRGGVRISSREVQGSLACLFIRPRTDSSTACVAVISGTDIVGMRLTNRLPVFTAGVGYPDWVLFGPEVLEKGTGGVLAAGFFGADWDVESGEFAWRPES